MNAETLAAAAAPAAIGAALHPALQPLIEAIARARRSGTRLRLCGSGSKDFYGEAATSETSTSEVLEVRALQGPIRHEPSELVVTAAAGTPLAELETQLAQAHQCLAFEPPHFGPGATVGGMLGAGLSGPARASAGSLRDHVLGATLLNGEGQVLHFGGQVIKNVAGYDVSRLLVGALGTLGIVVEVSMKVVPMARATASLRFEFGQAEAIERLNAWAGLPLPLHASAWWDGQLIVRLAGAEAAVRSAVLRLGGEQLDDALAAPFWQGLREQRDDFFVRAQRVAKEGGALWRLSVPQTAPALDLPGDTLIEWHGAQRWLIASLPAAPVRAAAAAVGGHATLFRANDKRGGVFTPLAPPLARIHRELKKAFDPHGVFDASRLCRDL